MNISTKQCNECNEVKEVTEFSKRSKSKDGLQPKCKACNKKINDKYRSENKEYWSYEPGGYFDSKEKWDYMRLYQIADKTIKIYVITFDDGETKYIGSTKCHLNVRLSRHIADYKRFLEGKRDRKIPLLHKKFGEFDSIEDIVEHLKNNTVIIEETQGGKTKQYRLEAWWIKRFINEGKYKLLNKSIPHRYKHLKG